MRKWMAALIIFILVFVFVYGFIPGKISIHQQVIIPCNTKAFARNIVDEQTWNQWWPENQRNHPPTRFYYNGSKYTVVEKKMSSVVITVSKGKDSVLTELIFIPLKNDTIELTWNGLEKTSFNPVSRIQNLSWSKTINADVQFLMNKMRSFYSSESNLYGLNIKKAFVPDSNLISTSTVSKAYPDPGIIYNQIDKLKDYIKKNGAKELGDPMLNIFKDADESYLIRVAIPVDKKLKNSGNIQYRWMLKGGNILVAEVKGGPAAIERAFDQMEDYVTDHQRIAPAIPFQTLVTDRRQVPDTNQWITTLFWPVM